MNKPFEVYLLMAVSLGMVFLEQPVAASVYFTGSLIIDAIKSR